MEWLVKINKQNNEQDVFAYARMELQENEPYETLKYIKLIKKEKQKVLILFYDLVFFLSFDYKFLSF